METQRTEARGRQVAVEIDHDLCSGTGHCAMADAETFEVTGRKSWLRPDFDPDAADLARLRDAESGCPWFAIEVSANET